jgi:flavin reductase (DIM6/NTAB) family NADH-FMN oxidoreductase RutF
MSVEFDAKVDPSDFKAVLGRWATGVAVVTTRGADGTQIGLTVNSFASVSLDPPLVLFSIGRDAGSFEAFGKVGCFAVNLLRQDQTEVSNRFADPEGERFAVDPTEQWVTGAPILTDALAALDCEIHARHDGGDHVIIVGRVRKLKVLNDGHPLGYWLGGYRALSSL